MILRPRVSQIAAGVRLARPVAAINPSRPSPLRPAVVTAPSLSSSASRQFAISVRNSQKQPPVEANTSSQIPPRPPQPDALPQDVAANPVSPPPQEPEADSFEKQQDQAKLRRRRRAVIFGAAFLLLGTTLGSLFRVTLAPPELPEPGSPEDAFILESIRKRATDLPLHQSLSTDPAWTSWGAYEGTRGDPKVTLPRLTSGPMAGARGLAYQRVFYNERTGECVNIVYFGGGIAGWPGVVHGGAIATVLDETLGRCAIKRFPSRTGVTANLELNYRAPTRTESFYVIRTRPAAATPAEPQGKSDRKLWVTGTLETVDGKVCVEAKALFVVPRGIQLKALVDDF